ncbi:unnamed protein product [Urochloa humidicola]
MSHRAESSSASRATRRQERVVSSVHEQSVAYPVGKETGLPLIVCPECHLARVIELRVKKETPNKGRSFFKCARNGIPKLCGFYRFQKEYFDELVDKKIIQVRCEQIEELAEELEGDELVDKKIIHVDDEGMQDLEKKLEKIMWKMNFVIVFVAIVVLGVVLKSFVKK